MKTKLRSEFKKLRNSLENKTEKSYIIQKSFLASSAYKNADTLLLYSSHSSEVSTDMVFRQAMLDSKKIAFPRCIDGNGIMEFYVVNGENDLEADMYGIKAPAEGCKKLTDNKNAVCIVPGLAFDKKGFRLGYGKGYYDRFLASFEGISIGFCYEETVTDRLLTDKYDKQVNFLITDKSTYKINFKEDLKNG